MSVLTHTITQTEDGCTVRDILTARFHISTTLRKQLRRREGAILLNDAPVTVAQRVRCGDLLRVDVSDEAGSADAILPVDAPLSVLWEDEHLLAIDKSAGIAVHPAALTEESVTVAGAVAHYLGSSAFHAVNRLDRGTTGVMLIAKNGYMHARCMDLLHTAALQREYRAVCDGIPSPAAGSITLPIGRDTDSLLRRCIDPSGQPAQTEYEVLQLCGERALLRLLPHTGRTHQLRVHMAAIGCPLTGDWLYGTEDRELIARPALHSHILRFTHPLTGEAVTVTAPLPQDMLCLLEETL
ncbi:MAG: RluA family pseudouridine synthase [Oscillospiraceae bacterium]|nr:RluA family pseudouridine synthase [Oscillospiraceae bacterium]